MITAVVADTVVPGVAAPGTFDPVTTTVVAAGVPALITLFYAEGLVIGKLLQPPLVFVAFVAASTPSTWQLAAIAVGCIGAATLGQWTLYRALDDEADELLGLRATLPYLEALPERAQNRIGDRRLSIVERYFEAYGGLGLAASNAVPGIRSLMTVPAGLGRYPTRRFLVASTVGNAAYVGLLIGAASGISVLARLYVL